jgi:hypothetical protein
VSKKREQPVRCCLVSKKTELELSAFSRQCLNRRIESMAELEREVKVWVRARNKVRATVDWQFSIQLAREKLAAKYPKLTN